MAASMVSRVRCLLVLALVCLAGCAREGTRRARHPRADAAAALSRRATGAGCSDEELHQRARQVLKGFASFYADSLAGNSTASGAPYEPDAYSAAHRTLPFGTRLRVTRTDTRIGPVCVTVNDRGPFRGRRRIIDLSRRAAEDLEMMGEGVVPVRVELF